MFKKLIVTIVLTHCISVMAQTACSNMSLGAMAPLNGFVPSPNDAWHQDISTAPLDPLSSTIMTATNDLGGGHLRANFTSVAGGNYGVPYTVVDSSTIPSIPLPITLYPSESDITLVPIPAVLPVEEATGYCPLGGNDRHAIIIDRNQCVMYEIYQADHCTTNGWTGSDMAVWDLTSTEKRPYGYTSADAAGLSIFEGLIRYDEIVAGVMNHAIRFTARFTKTNSAHGLFTAPATHAAGNSSTTDNIMGMRLRLKANYDISGFSTTNQIILTALKKYGMILADNGSNLFLEGTPDARWNDSDLNALKTVLSSGLEVVQMGPLYDSNTAPKGAAPVITSFTASATTIPAGGSVTLTPIVTGASYSYIDKAGFVRGPVTVSPTVTTTYTLTSRNEFGTTSASVTVTVGGTQTVPTLTFASVPTQTFGAAPFAVSASSQSTGAITYSISSGPATISGSTVTLTGIGTVVVKATQAAAGTYSATSATTSFTVSAANPGLAFVAIPDLSYTTTPLTISTTTSSTGSITYSVVSGPATISGNKVTFTGIGTVSLQANQVAAGNYLAGVATTAFHVLAANPQLTLAAIPDQLLNAAPFAVTATSLSNAPITYTVASGNATISGNVVTVTGTGTVLIQANQVAAGNYISGVATTSFNVTSGQTTPTLVFTAIATQTFGVAPFNVHAGSASSGAVTYSVISGPATISGSLVTLTGVGTVVLQASQAAAGSYGPATATTSFLVQALTLTSISPSSGSQGSSFSVTLSGSGFTAPLTVNSGSGITVSNVSVLSGTSATATFTIAATAATGARSVSVTTPAGTSNTAVFTVNAASNLPTLTSVTPSSGARGTSVNVTLTGTNFAAGSWVGLQGAGLKQINIVVVSPTQITATFTIAPTVTTGPHNTTIVTSAGTSNILPFTVN